MVNIVFAPVGWLLDEKNPLTNDSFPTTWRGLYLNDKNDGQFWNGTSKSNLFSVSYNRAVADLEQRIFDFLRYNEEAGNMVIVGTNYHHDLQSTINRILAQFGNSPRRRENDSRFVVHSTSPGNWRHIKRELMLKSPNRLQADGGMTVLPGRDLLGDPDEFLDYIHFAPYESLHTEFVVASREKGVMCCDENAEYRPGARIYLDHFKMIDDGIIVRDGLHYSKVKHKLDLSRYMVFFVHGDSNAQTWTPKTFAHYATEEFHSYLKKTNSVAAKENATT